MCQLDQRLKRKQSQCEGPIRMPMETVSITTKKSLVVKVLRLGMVFRGESTKDTDQPRSSEVVQQVASIGIEPGVEDEVTNADA
ncbi:40S ribosomal protein S20 [Sciurus carolinensis]|uniref:40S ribosomal protein S20 n=1 Tax=Sciurus carolinensis TaxID=30640 RepID=A0AA41NEH9_SCICA|nr:40S ribosomal protein S20 [Sciurus carolinensis]